MVGVIVVVRWSVLSLWTVAGVVVVTHAYSGSMGSKVVMWYCVLVRGLRAGGGGAYQGASGDGWRLAAW